MAKGFNELKNSSMKECLRMTVTTELEFKSLSEEMNDTKENELWENNKELGNFIIKVGIYLMDND